jgi:hypothetical protein
MHTLYGKMRMRISNRSDFKAALDIKNFQLPSPTPTHLAYPSPANPRRRFGSEAYLQVPRLCAGVRPPAPRPGAELPPGVGDRSNATCDEALVGKPGGVVCFGSGTENLLLCDRNACDLVKWTSWPSRIKVTLPLPRTLLLLFLVDRQPRLFVDSSTVIPSGSISSKGSKRANPMKQRLVSAPPPLRVVPMRDKNQVQSVWSKEIQPWLPMDIFSPCNLIYRQRPGADGDRRCARSASPAPSRCLATRYCQAKPFCWRTVYEGYLDP